MSDQMPYYPPPSVEAAAPSGLTTLEKADLIRGVEVFSQATVEELYRLAGMARVVEFSPPGVLFGENDLGDSFYVLVEGSVELASETNKTHEVVGRGEVVGLHSVLTRERRSATATVLEPTLALSIAAEDLYTVLSNNMEIVVSMFKHFVKKLEMGSRG